MSVNLAPGPNPGAAAGALPIRAQINSGFARRLTFGVIAVTTTLALTGWFASIVGAGDFGLVEASLLAIFVLCVPSQVISFWNAALGFVLLHGGAGAGVAVPYRNSDQDTLTARTVIAMVMRNEPPARAFAQLKAMAASLARLGHLASFDFFVLSDSDQPEVIAVEQAAVAAWAEADGGARLFYRRRVEHSGFKSGNVHEFCENAGRNYELMVLLDSDSLMSGAALVRLVRAMQANPRFGILQTFSVGLPSRSLFARIFLFGHRHSMRCAMAGAAWWQGDCGHFWGHNCIIRVEPFAQHCRLPYLPGGPFAGRRVANCASHDQIEAALMRRAGYEVRFLPEEGGSYEDNPPALPQYLRRYRRWSLGSIQNLKLLDIPSLVPMSRYHLCLLAERYAGAAGIVVFALLAAWAAASWPAGWPVPSRSAAALYIVWVMMFFAPKLFGVADALLRSRERFGGTVRLLAGCLAESVFTCFLAPLSMYAAGAAMLKLLFRGAEIWEAQQRDGYCLSWAEAAAQLWPPTLFGLALLGFLTVEAPRALPWFLPFLAGLVLAIPFAVATASPALGAWAAAWKLCASPEELDVPDEVTAVRPELARVG